MILKKIKYKSTGTSVIVEFEQNEIAEILNILFTAEKDQPTEDPAIYKKFNTLYSLMRNNFNLVLKDDGDITFKIVSGEEKL